MNRYRIIVACVFVFVTRSTAQAHPQHLPVTEATNVYSQVEQTDLPADTTDYSLAPTGIEYVTITVDPEKWFLTIIGHNYRLPLDATPPVLASIKSDPPRKMNAKVAPHFNEMYDAAKADGVTLIVSSGYRSIEHQKKAFNTHARRIAEREGVSPAQAARMASSGTAFPGASEHNLGISMDILTAGESKVGHHIIATDQFEWLTANAADYGFVLRYPSGKKAITGVNYEPWHWRYVGVEVAKKLIDQDMCLEEYLGIYYLSPESAMELKEKGISVEEHLRNQGKQKGCLYSGCQNNE